MTKVLVIDSHKSSNNGEQQNLHWRNAKCLADAMGGDLIWSYPGVNDKITGGYEKIVFVHASPYAYTDYAWLEASPDAELFYVTNEYNLGEPRTAWMAAKKAGRHYTVIANHDASISKVVKKYVKSWEILNIIALYFNGEPEPQDFTASGCVYYGSFRAGRAKYFAHYLHSPVVLSTHATKVEKFRELGADCPVIPRLSWGGAGSSLECFKATLYIEDEITHTHYNHLANRFYEALNYSCPTLVDASCMGTFRTAGYRVPAEMMVKDCRDIQDRLGMTLTIPAEWYEQAARDKRHALGAIMDVILGPAPAIHIEEELCVTTA
jgi:hypothetical protein